MDLPVRGRQRSVVYFFAGGQRFAADDGLDDGKKGENKKTGREGEPLETVWIARSRGRRCGWNFLGSALCHRCRG